MAKRRRSKEPSTNKSISPLAAADRVGVLAVEDSSIDSAASRPTTRAGPRANRRTLVGNAVFEPGVFTWLPEACVTNDDVVTSDRTTSQHSAFAGGNVFRHLARRRTLPASGAKRNRDTWENAPLGRAFATPYPSDASRHTVQLGICMRPPLMGGTGFEVDSLTFCEQRTSGNPVPAGGAECAALRDNSLEIPPELAKLWATLDENQQRELLAVLQKLGKTAEDP